MPFFHHKNFICIISAAVLLAQATYIHASKSCLSIPHDAIVALTAKGAYLSKEKQADYARFHTSDTCYLEARPTNTDQVASLVKTAYKYHIPIRTQGGSHSQNGTSLPRNSELLIYTHNLKNLVIIDNNEILAGSGIPVAAVNEFLASYQMRIPVYNQGETYGPTIGGFISAGGVSAASDIYGGFWDQVNEITLVTGYGQILRIKPQDKYFLWLFGSMGQLGIITEAKLKLIDISFNPDKKRLANEKIKVDFKLKGGSVYAKNNEEQPYLWFVLFVSKQELEQATDALVNLQKKYSKALIYNAPFNYRVNTIKAPPLIYPKNGEFYLLNIWGKKINEYDNIAQFKNLNIEYEQLIAKKKYRRYIQAEYYQSSDVYIKYFDHGTYSEFSKIKSQLDPSYLFNRNSFFSQKGTRSSKSG